MKLWLTAALVVLNGCAFLHRETRSRADLERTADALAVDIARLDSPRNLAFLGTRDSDGKQTPETKVLDRRLIGAFRDAGFDLAVGQQSATEPWAADGLLPPSLDVLSGNSRVLGGRVYSDGRWAYVRLALVDPRTRVLQLAELQRLPRESLERLARTSFRGEQKDIPLEIELHILGLRREAGFADQVEVEDGAVLEPGDELQIRFRVNVECDIVAFLLSAQGDVRSIFGGSVFGGRSRYRPYESYWLGLGSRAVPSGSAASYYTPSTGKVEYTLYFVAAPRLEDGDEMFRAIDEFLTGRTEDLSDWDSVDETVKRHLLSGDDGGTVSMQGGQPRGQLERFLLSDGTTLENRSEILRGNSGLFRSLRFSVQ
jgi:hypothetical protein